MSEMLNGLFSVEGKIAVVTGGTSGIGLMIADGLVKAGVKTYIVARNEAVANKVAAELSENGFCKAIIADLSTVAGVNAVVAEFSAVESQLDILVNNAGVLYEGPIEEFTEEEWDVTFDVNVKPVFFLTQKMLPLLRASASTEDPARVINIGSADGSSAAAREYYAYSASKAAVHHMTKGLAKHLSKDHLTINTIAPGPFPSPMTDRFPQEAKDMVAAIIPRGRFGHEDDVVGTVIYLASRAGAYTTASVIPLDGGLTGAS